MATLEHDHAWWTMDHIRETPGVELVGVFDRQEHLREKARKRLTNSVPLFDDPEKMLKTVKPDALIVTAPNNEHRDLVELATRYRIHCLVQKPMATTAADARAMQKAAAAADITLMVNYYPLWQPARHELLTRAKAGEIGEVQQMTVVNGMQGPKDMNVLTPDYRKWLYDPERNGGHVMGDQVTYGLDYVLWVMGRPESVVATITPIKKHEEGIDDLATLTLSYLQDVVSTLLEHRHRRQVRLRATRWRESRPDDFEHRSHDQAEQHGKVPPAKPGPRRLQCPAPLVQAPRIERLRGDSLHGIH